MDGQPTVDELCHHRQLQRAAEPWRNVECGGCGSSGPWMHVDPLTAWFGCPRCTVAWAEFGKSLDQLPEAIDLWRRARRP